MKQTKGFTLIELLIVVAIIAILAAIAVPNFLEAQVRSKVSRGKSDMRAMATAIEAYAIDYNKYPSICAPTGTIACRGGLCPGGTGVGLNGLSVFYPGTGAGVSSRFIWVTTPIAYVTSVFRDPFINENNKYALNPSGTLAIEYDTYDYVDAATFKVGESTMLFGPAGDSAQRGASITSGAGWHMVGCGPDGVNAFGGGYAGQSALFNNQGVDYDPSNGTISAGDIVRIGGGPGPLYTKQPAINRISNTYNF